MTFSYFTHFTRFPGVLLQVPNLHQHIMLPSDPLPQTHLSYKGAPLATFAHPPLQGPSSNLYNQVSSPAEIQV